MEKRIILILVFILFATTGFEFSGGEKTDIGPPLHPLVHTEPIRGLQELFLVTAFIEMFVDDSRVGTGTGFFCLSEDRSRIFLVTNRHIVRNDGKQMFPDRLRLRLHADPLNLKHFENYDVRLYGDITKTQRRWKELDPSIDVVSIELPLSEIGKYYIKAFHTSDFAREDTELGVGEPVVIIGYPLGFFDEVHSLPVARQGSIASVYPIPFRDRPFFLVDAHLHPGTSGSPVITRPAGGRIGSSGEEKEGVHFYLIGINSGGYGDLELNAIWFTNVIKALIE